MGHRHILLDTVDSTNRYAGRLLKTEQPPEGTIITAQYQTAGRGQRGNDWHGEPGKNLAMSIVLYPTFLSLNRQFALSQTVALGVYDCLNEILGSKVHIKWANDLYYGNKKIGGILIENNVNARNWVASIVGIGLNINQTEFSTHLPNPISLAMITGNEFDVLTIVKKLCHCVERQYLQLRADKLAHLHHTYRQLLYRYRETAQYQTADGNVMMGKIIDVTEQGKLVIAATDSNGVAALREFDIKEIKFIWHS